MPSYFAEFQHQNNVRVKESRAMEIYKKNKQIVINYACFCSATILTSKIPTEITKTF